MPKQKPLCPNCGAEVKGKYCYNCGEKIPGHHDLSFKHFIFHTVVHELTHLDGKIFRTLKYLFIKPGGLSYDYFSGKKTRYINPFRLFLTFLIILVIFNGFLQQGKHTSLKEAAASMDPTGYTSQVVNERAAKENIETGEFREKFNSRFKTYQNLFSFSIVVLLSLLFMLFFRKEKKFYIEHLVFALYTASFILLVSLVSDMLQHYFLKTSGFGLSLSPGGAELWSGILFNYPALAIQLAYVYLALRKFYGSSVKKSILTLPAIFILLFLIQNIMTVVAFLVIFNTTSAA
jgi:uncharacterized membrane protein